MHTAVLKKTRIYVKTLLSGEVSGHDWYHIERVVKVAHFIQTIEGGDPFIIELASLLHDIADHKFNDDQLAGGKIARKLLKSFDCDETTIESVVHIVDNISYKGGTNTVIFDSLEGRIVQDADRLDAIGAIGIARTFSYGGNKGRSMYNPDIKPGKYGSLEEFKNAENHTINHFYEKLLLLRDLMNTKTGKRLAQKRHSFMEKFLKEFYNEWNVEDII